MANVTTVASEVARDFGYCLAYLEQRLAELEDVAQAWSELSSEDRNDFLFEWPVVEDKLNALRGLVQRQGLPAQHQACYQRLMGRVDQDRPMLERLQAS